MAQRTQEVQTYITERLEQLKPIFQRIAVGDFSQKIDYAKGDEFSDLFSALNTMIADLKISVEKNISLVQRLEGEKQALEMKSKEAAAANQQLKAANQQFAAYNQQLIAAQQSLEGKIRELERFNRVTVGREMKMVELKEEIARLKKQCGIEEKTTEAAA